ncbi:MAG: serine hydrolase [Thermoleophilia bacterium]|nr:serine hydrolase [Thermoleophilia bacterium]
MRSIRKPLALSALVMLLASAPLLAQELPRAVPEAAGMSSERLDRLTATFEKYVADGQLAGAPTIVLRDGNVVYDEAVGYRDLESRAPMSTDASRAGMHSMMH